jgi:hypothetical protein
MTKLVRTIRTAVMVLSLVVGASAVVGGATTDPAMASPVERASTAGTTATARAPSCPDARVCFWSGSNFTGTRGVFRPVNAGDCLKIAEVDSGWSSAYNNTFVPIRVWAFADDTSDGTKCVGRNGIIFPGQSVGRFSFGVAEALGSL